MSTMPPLSAPFVWFGGKSRAAALIWPRLGDTKNYCEPFAGSLAILLKRPHAPGIETVNDLDGFVCNVFRAIAADPEQVARYADWPAVASDMHARHIWLKARRVTLTAQLEGDPGYYDAKIAGWWLWGVNLWIGGGWCSAETGGPWQVQDGQLLRLATSGQGVRRKRLHLGNAGMGVHRQMLHLGGPGSGAGVHAKHASGDGLLTWFAALQARLRRVRVECGDWLRIMAPSVLETHGVTGVVLDPPYQRGERDDVYAVDTAGIAEDARRWALAHGDNPLLRIVLCGYETATYTMPDSWEKVTWKAQGGMGNQGHGRGRANTYRETLWFSPHCLQPQQGQIPLTFGATP